MKPTSLLRSGLLASMLAAAGTGLALAQDNPAPPTPFDGGTNAPPADGGPGGGGPGGWHHHDDKVLTPAEKAELKADTEKVFAANPELKQEGETLRSSRPDQDASEEDKQAYREKMKDHRDKVKAAVEAIDPNAAAIYAKIEAAMKKHHWGGPGGPGGGAPGQSQGTPGGT